MPSRPLQLLACPRHSDGALPYMADASSSIVVEMGFLTVEHSLGQQPFSRVFYAPQGTTLWLHRSTPVSAIIVFQLFGRRLGGRLLTEKQKPPDALTSLACASLATACLKATTCTFFWNEIYAATFWQDCFGKEDMKNFHSILQSRHLTVHVVHIHGSRCKTDLPFTKSESWRKRSAWAIIKLPRNIKTLHENWHLYLHKLH